MGKVDFKVDELRLICLPGPTHGVFHTKVFATEAGIKHFPVFTAAAKAAGVLEIIKRRHPDAFVSAPSGGAAGWLDFLTGLQKEGVTHASFDPTPESKQQLTLVTIHALIDAIKRVAPKG